MSRSESPVKSTVAPRGVHHTVTRPTAAGATADSAEARTVPRRRVFHSDEELLAQAIMATAPRRTAAAVNSATAKRSVHRDAEREHDDAFASPSPKVPHRSEAAFHAGTTARAAATVAAPPHHPVVATPLTATQLALSLLPDDELPMTATQTALAPADGYRAPSPPPLFSLRSVSMAAARIEDDVTRRVFTENVIVPETGTMFPAPTGSTEADRAKLWASSAKAFFDFIDERPLLTVAKTHAPVVGPSSSEPRVAKQ